MLTGDGSAIPRANEESIGKVKQQAKNSKSSFVGWEQIVSGMRKRHFRAAVSFSAVCR